MMRPSVRGSAPRGLLRLLVAFALLAPAAGCSSGPSAEPVPKREPGAAAGVGAAAAADAPVLGSKPYERTATPCKCAKLTGGACRCNHCSKESGSGCYCGTGGCRCGVEKGACACGHCKGIAGGAVCACPKGAPADAAAPAGAPANPAPGPQAPEPAK